jgi:hypothetical protein
MRDEMPGLGQSGGDCGLSWDRGCSMAWLRRIVEIAAAGLVDVDLCLKLDANRCWM